MKKRSLRLQEYVTVPDLQDKAAISQKTAYHLTKREIVSGDASDNITLDSVLIEDDSITFLFTSFATIEAYGDDHEYKKVGKNHRLRSNPSKEYSVYLKFLDTKTWMSNMVKRDRVDAGNIETLVNRANVQVWCTSPAWHFQGHNYWSSQLDASIFPTKIKPQKWDKHHDETQLDKHTAQLLSDLARYYPEMAEAVKREM